MIKGAIIELMDDMHLSNEDIFHSYYDAVNEKNISQANQIINNNSQVQNQITDSNNINKLISQVNEDENMIKTDVDNFLDNQLQEFQNLIDQTKVMGTYNNTTQYEIHNLVYYQNKGYYAYKKPPIGTMPTDEDYWLEYDIRGLKGYGGVNLNFKFAWDANTVYQPMDCVFYQNKLWFANMTNQGVAPSLAHFPWLPAMIPLMPVKTQIRKETPTTYISSGDFWFKIIKGNDLENTKWAEKASQILPRYAAAVFVFGDEIHIAGGDNSLDEKQVEHQVYDTLTDTWSFKAEMPAGVSGQGSFTIGNKGYSVGGINNEYKVINTLYIYDNTTNTWSTGSNLPDSYMPLFDGSTNGTLGYITTATDKNNLPSGDSYSYNPTTDTWTKLATCPMGLAGSSAVYYNGKIYVHGGIDYTGGTSDALYIYDIASNSWSMGASSLFKSSYTSTFYDEERLYFCGGFNENGYSINNVQVYDAKTNTWENEVPMEHARTSAQGCVCNNKGYVIGGLCLANDFGTWGYNEQYNLRPKTIALEVTFTYSNNNGLSLTNQDVTATLTANKPIQNVAGWTRETDSVFTKIFSQNTKGTVTVTDLEGNSIQASYEVKRIDKVPPDITVKTGSTETIGDAINGYTRISFKIHDANGLASYAINGTVTNLSGAPQYSDINYVSTSTKGAIIGDNILTVTDKAGNNATYTFKLIEA